MKKILLSLVLLASITGCLDDPISTVCTVEKKRADSLQTLLDAERFNALPNTPVMPEAFRDGDAVDYGKPF